MVMTKFNLIERYNINGGPCPRLQYWVTDWKRRMLKPFPACFQTISNYVKRGTDGTHLS